MAIGATLVALVAVAAVVVAVTNSNRSVARAHVSTPAVTASTARAVLTAMSSSNPTSGPGLTSPTAPSGAKVSGGTVYFTEGPDAVPNYIFPLYTFADCSTTNINQLMDIIYKPLYWYGNDYSPAIDYSYSIGQKPGFSNGGKTVTIKLNSWKWSDGEAVTSRDLVFWMNLMKASPSTEWCGYAPGYFPDNVVKYSAPNPSTFTITFNKAYDPEWIINSELSQLVPLPLSWDRTSLSQAGPTTDNGHLPDTTKSGALAVYKFLDTQGKQTTTWGTSPLWSVVDGPFKVQGITSTGQLTFVANPNYSGAQKPKIAKLVELPFTSEAAIYNEMKSQGTSAITIGNLPAQYAPQAASLVSQGYTDNKAASYSFNYFPLNFNSSATTTPGGEPVRYIFRQTYFREAFQHLIDQPGWIKAFLNNTANVTCGPIPLSPASPLVKASALSTTPCAYNVALAAKLLKSNGWSVKPGGSSTCIKPGTAAGDCGAGIKAGEGISLNIDYESGVVAVQNEMNDLTSNAKKVGITLSLSTHPFQSVVAAGAPCTPNKPTCKWTAENWGAGWIYGPSYLPTGEPLYNPGSAANAGSYSDPKMTKLISATITGPLSQESAALAAYDEYASAQVPVVYGPTSIGTFAGDAGTLVDSKLGGYAANALGLMNPEDWYFTK
jgi:peptide/nickel transport system substrate-binding protein